MSFAEPGLIETRTTYIEEERTSMSNAPIALEAHYATTVAFIAVTLSSIFILALHLLRPDLAPSWRMLSEYANGPYGWMMKVAFWLMALGNLALAFALHPHAGSVLGIVGVVLHVIVGLALVGAGLFDMDPITISSEAATRDGKLHGLASIIGVPGQVLAALTLAWALTRSGQVFEGSAILVLSLALATLVSLLAMFGYLAYALPTHGGIGPNVSAGWFNRFVMLTFMMWIGGTSLIARSL